MQLITNYPVMTNTLINLTYLKEISDGSNELINPYKKKKQYKQQLKKDRERRELTQL